MPSPFPGMDPYLESVTLWPSFHRQLIAGVYQLLLPSLVDHYRARVCVRNYTTELVLFTSIAREPHAEEYVEIRSRADGRLVTLVEIVSIMNRTSNSGRDAYLTTRKHAETARAALVEIDLLTQGQPTLEYDRAGVPSYDHCLTVTRPNAPGRYEVYTATFAKRLPKIRVPLAPDDRDVMLDVQDVVRRAYDQGNYARQIDYTLTHPAEVVMSAETQSWCEVLLTQAKLRD
jgi:hypothetical protein